MAISIACFLFLLTLSAGPEELMHRDVEQKLSEKSGATIINAPHNAPGLDLAVIEADTQARQSNIAGMQADALMERRFAKQRVAAYTALAFAFVWIPAFLFLFLTSPKSQTQVLARP